MFQGFRNQLHQAMIQRGRMKLPHIKSMITVSVICTLAFIILAIFVTPSGAPPEHQFVRERGAITVLSSIFLTMASTFSLSTIVVLIWAKEKDRQMGLWILLSMVFTFFAFDELMQFHERFGDVIANYVDPGIFRNWNDVVVILYGCIALPVMIALLPMLIRYKRVLESFIVAFVFYGIHTLIDSTQDPRTTVSAILEESAKLFCVEFLAIGALMGFLGVLWNVAPINGIRNHESL